MTTQRKQHQSSIQSSDAIQSINVDCAISELSADDEASRKAGAKKMKYNEAEKSRYQYQTQMAQQDRRNQAAMCFKKLDAALRQQKLEPFTSAKTEQTIRDLAHEVFTKMRANGDMYKRPDGVSDNAWHWYMNKLS